MVKINFDVPKDKKQQTQELLRKYNIICTVKPYIIGNKAFFEARTSISRVKIFNREFSPILREWALQDKESYNFSVSIATGYFNFSRLNWWCGKYRN